MIEQCITCSLLLTLAALLTGTEGSAPLYDFGPVASDASLSPADELFMQVTLRDPLIYLGEADSEVYVSAFSLLLLVSH